ncbi:bifunctional phosphatidyl-N-methylethanolamine N-methyltransferase/phosphatidyl-N-dimethylethanolamine N-methyltransferase [Aspergillus novofumigatus IBT 16806]|uniref:Phosphatidyl-N-methylethanolamine N-methyltransferase n=1 Tax=Aspergillus novofumigatus (strain IBT 16806) TaxID=1392255 RepID=A0A2I1CA17_ASPN1|nr:phospholipid methyltransferase [Aspergillus novofumigatus IBT 16806]PKX94464.1 phospholipid methyltransferase [Aspergillus novofumigatus IBT 16806]
MAHLVDYIDFSQRSFQGCALFILFNPLFWNIVARAEYRKHYLTRMFGSPYYGCYFLGFIIFTLGLARDHVYQLALQDQPYYAPVHQPILGSVLFGIGSILVLSSMYALGVTGTYLGDYFGILMDAPVTGFPFNVFIVYWIALQWEDPFTAEIYAKRERERAKSKKGGKGL